MAEPEIYTDFTDQKIVTCNVEESQFKLPRIDQLQVRNKIRSNVQNRQNVIFPGLKKQANSHKFNQQKCLSPKEKIQQAKQNQQFVLDIQKKIKHVMENVNYGQNISESPQKSEDIDFLELVSQNKAIIKQQKQRKDHRNNHLQSQSSTKGRKKSKAGNNQSIKNLDKQQHAYQKKRMSYKQGSVDNKSMEKKKDSVIKNQAIQRAKMMMLHHREGKQSPKNNQPNNYPPKFAPKPKIMRKDSPSKPLIDQNKTTNLFDNIHSFLQNPQKVRNSLVVNHNSASQIKKLQYKLQKLNEKLGLVDREQTKQTDDNIIFQNGTVRDWKRIEYNQGHNLKCCYDSNFEKQLDRVASLQEKNNQFLNQYIQNQTLLLQLGLIRKVHPIQKHSR